MKKNILIPSLIILVVLLFGLYNNKIVETANNSAVAGIGTPAQNTAAASTAISADTAVTTNAAATTGTAVNKTSTDAAATTAATVNKRTKINPIAIKTINPKLNKIIQSGWDKNFKKILGSPDSQFDGYDVYFYNGIKVDLRQKVFNIVFNNKFKEEIVNGLTMKASKDQIIKSLGKPQFEITQENIFGYKSDKFYIFFITDDNGKNISEVSVYRRDTGYDKAMIKELVKGFNEQTVNDKYEYLRKKWPYYDLAYNERGSLGVKYYSMGVELLGDFGGAPYIKIYGNYDGDITDEMAHNDLVTLEPDTDSVFEYETNRIKNDKLLASLKGVLSPNGLKMAMSNDAGTYEHAGIYIFDIKKNKPDIEIRTPHLPDEIQWLNNRYLLYRVYMYGIYLYDVQKNQAIIVVGPKNGDIDLSEYEIKSVKDSKITYTKDDKTLIKKYSFSKNGDIVFK